MRRFLVSSIVFAACLAAASAFAANDRVIAKFESIAPAGVGVTGQVALNAMPSGQTLIHGSLRGLVPNTEYVAFIYPQGVTCGSGDLKTEIVTFEANPAGSANFTKRVAVEVTQIGSISLQRVNDSALLSCAAVTP